MKEKQHNEYKCHICGADGFKTDGDSNIVCKRCSGIIPASKSRTVIRQHKKIGRNESCPCGSGTKYKYCCGTRYMYN